MQKAISILLCILMLASSTNITYAKHFCGDHEMLSIITIGEKHLTCGMKMEVTSCMDEKQKDHPCCKNKYENVEVDDNFANTSINTLINIPFVKSFVSVFVLQLVNVDQKPTPIYADYESPPLDKETLILYQVFII